MRWIKLSIIRIDLENNVDKDIWTMLDLENKYLKLLDGHSNKMQSFLENLCNMVQNGSKLVNIW
jgi:hypothetical protein